MAGNRGGSHTGHHSYSGKGSRPRLDRSNANKGIDYDSTGSYRRRRNSDVDDDDGDMSGHSREDWTLEEFSVHGKQDVAEMNMMFRYLGLPGPANLGIDNEAYELIKRTPSMGSPVDGYQYTPRQESRTNDFSFHQDSQSSSPVSNPRSSSSPTAAGLFTRSSAETSPLKQRGQTPISYEARAVETSSLKQRDQTPSSHEARAVENRTPTAGGSPPTESDGGAKRGRPSFHGFVDVVKKAVEQHQHRIQEDAAAVSNFITSHGVPDLTRKGSLPSNLEDVQNPRAEAASVSAESIERAQSEPIIVSSLREAETSVLDDKKEAEDGLAVQNVVKLENRDQDGEGRRTSPKADLVRLAPPPVVLKPLKPPPAGSRTLKIQHDQFSSKDFINSLAPDVADDVAASVFSTSDDEERNDSETDDDQESPTAIREAGATADVNPEPKDEDVVAEDAAKSQGNRTDLTVDVPDRILEQIVQVKIDENPEPSVVPGPNIQVGPKHPWSKGDMLGQGSFGTVYDAVDSDGMWFAVKEVSMVEQDKQAQQSIAQLMQEIELLSQFKHDNVVQYLGTEKAHGKLYIFLELVSKGSLATICKRIKLTHSQISAYTRQILKGLKYLHDRNIVHRDIKCANILVDTMGVCKLADFGMAKQMNSLDQMKSCKGSAYWMAPEVIDPKKFSGLPADIWSLGCSILEMATGSPPFGDMEWYRVLWTVGHGNAPPIPDSLSDTAKDFVKHCLAITPSQRPTATELLNHPFVRQDAPSTPSCNVAASFSHEHNLATITEELSVDLNRGSSTQTTQSLSNGHSETASS